MRNFLSQWGVLVRRNFRVFFSDATNLAVALVQAPVIAAFTWLAFSGFAADDRSSDVFARAVHYFHELKAPYIARGDAVPLDPVAREAMGRAKAAEAIIGESAAQRRGSIYFVLVSAAIWFGIMGACREIVQEMPVLHREARSGVRLSSYLLAKLAVQVAAVGVQTAALTALLAGPMLGQAWTAGVALWSVLWLTGVTAACLGLLISSLAPTLRAALTLVPILMMPQILMGGLLRPPGRVAPMFARDAITFLTLQRWGFEAAVTTDRFAHGGVLAVEFGEPKAPTDQWRYTEMDMLRTQPRSLLTQFFRPRPPPGHVRVPVLVLAGMGAATMLGAYVWLRRRVG